MIRSIWNSNTITNTNSIDNSLYHIHAQGGSLHQHLHSIIIFCLVIISNTSLVSIWRLIAVDGMNMVIIIMIIPYNYIILIIPFGLKTPPLSPIKKIFRLRFILENQIEPI